MNLNALSTAEESDLLTLSSGERSSEFDALYTPDDLGRKAEALFREQKQLRRLDGWFLIQELRMEHDADFASLKPELRAAALLEVVVEKLPLSLSRHAVFAGTQNDAFARSYALINPSFRVEGFEGYCDPIAVFNDIKPNKEFPRERIDRVKAFFTSTPYVKELRSLYSSIEAETGEVAYFVEQVTGHTIADFQGALHEGVAALVAKLDKKIKEAAEPRKTNFKAMRRALLASVTLAERYAALAREQAAQSRGKRRRELELLAETLTRVPRLPARNLLEAVQSFIILWQVMCLEQSPNPFAFSAGNVDRIFEPFRLAGGTDRTLAAGLFKHLLTFLNVGDRSWAISQNLLVGGRSSRGKDLTSESTYAWLDAFCECNYPQPILSVKLHGETPEKLYRELGRFFFSPGTLTPSLFNDEAMFRVLSRHGVAKADLENYAIAGCQEPLIMGKDSANTTNSWLNLPKILELTLNDGRSMITGKKVGLSAETLSGKKQSNLAMLRQIRPLFYRHLEHFVRNMVAAANGCSRALARLPVPFLSAFMGGIDSGYDMRDTEHQGTPYNGSGCLIHGLSNMADSFVAIDAFLKERPEEADRLLEALRRDFQGHEDIRQFLASCEKFGNNGSAVDAEAVAIAERVSELISRQKNFLGNPFRPDWSSPSTHLLYGYWVAATPDGRRARQMLGYGVDPLFGEADSGLYFRINSVKKLPFEKMHGGYASHFGINPKYFPEKSLEDKGLAFRDKVIQPLFFSGDGKVDPFYLYVNVNTAETLKKVLANPKKYAPSGVYIMRIHGTFVNFLDLSPAIQKDIIERLDPDSTALA